MSDVVSKIGGRLSNSLLMAWAAWWALAFGSAVSAVVQAWVPRDRIERAARARGQ
jgi:hypothetical protein